MKLGNTGHVSGGLFLSLLLPCATSVSLASLAPTRVLWKMGEVVAALGDDVIVARELVLLTLRLPTCMYCAYLRYSHTCTL